MTTIKSHRYANKFRKPGDIYEIRGQSDTRLVKAMGWAIEATPAALPASVPPAAAAPAAMSPCRFRTQG
jgi:hypothetical protein